MENFQKLKNNLYSWLSNANNIKAKAEDELLNYAGMPIRRFSNPYSEKAAGYVRIPPSVSLDHLGLWHAGYGAKQLIQKDMLFANSLGIAAGYLYLSFVFQEKIFRKGMVGRCSILRDWAAFVYFFLASCQDKDKFIEVPKRIKELNDEGNLRDLGSKVAVFCVSIIEAQNGNTEEAIGKIISAQSTLNDSFGLLNTYKKMVEKFNSGTSSKEYSQIIDEALENHIKEASQKESDAEFFDFLWEPWAIIPYEVIGYVNMVNKKFNILIEFPNTELGQICKTFLSNPPIVQYDNIANSVLLRAEKVLPQ